MRPPFGSVVFPESIYGHRLGGARIETAHLPATPTSPTGPQMPVFLITKAAGINQTNQI